ncbi:hypothetical protein [Lewinella sp. LCG006]|uniref:hypothetical protein n=1 Tax=Lewinella sp. LCG006 TaxID=3231911 RepID=UPI0034608CF7
MRHKNQLNHPALLPLWKSLERDWFLQLCAILLLLCVGFALVLWGMQASPLVLSLAIMLVVAGGYLCWMHFRQPTALERLQDRLYDQPASVVWVYGIVQQHHPFGLQINQRGILYFKFSDGDEQSVYLPPEKIKLISKVLSRALPNTVFGYTKERAAQYAQNPRFVE